MIHWQWGTMGLLFLLLASCYDAPRTNPFDPALTPAVELLSVAVDSTSGSATLQWTPYEGKQPFAEYRVLRQVRGLVAVDTVAKITDVRQTAFRDTTLRPEVEYGYWVEVVNQGGFEVKGEKQEKIVYALPSVELLQAEFSSDTATARLLWTRYRGPYFATYEVRRRALGAAETIEEEIADVDRTAYVDSALDGNTEYAYRLFVRTLWGESTGVFSNEQRGRFYALSETVQLRVSGNEIQAVGLALDEQDRLYVAATSISTTTARVMKSGISIKFPDFSTYRSFFDNEVTPDRLSPVQAVARQGKLYVAVRTKEGKGMIGSVNEARRQEWARVVETEGAFPVGLYVEDNGEVLMVDSQGLVYRFDATGNLIETDAGLQNTLQTDQALPLRHMAVGQGAGLGEGEMFFLLAPDRDRHHVIGRVRTRLGTRQIFAGRLVFTEGVGPGDGETLSPLALAFDRSRTRLVVLEAQGRLQVFDARAGEALQRYITKWGRFGRGEGEFQISPPTAVSMVVDSQGRIYVADGENRVQVFAP